MLFYRSVIIHYQIYKYSFNIFHIMKNENPNPAVVMTARELKYKYRPEFATNFQKYYPVKVFDKIGFTRTSCPKCHHNYWRKSEKATTCGDSNCLEKYTFIGKGTGIGKSGILNKEIKFHMLMLGKVLNKVLLLLEFLVLQ